MLNAAPLEHFGRRPMGCIVTIDAAGCQKKIVRKIVDKHADYLISLKGNQSTEGALRAKRPVFQRSAASIQRNWPLAAGC